MVEALLAAHGAFLSRLDTLVAREITGDLGAFCLDGLSRVRRAMFRHEGADGDDLVLVLVHADLSWISYLLQNINGYQTLMRPAGLLEADALIQQEARALLGPRPGPMGNYMMVIGPLFRMGDEKTLLDLYSSLPGLDADEYASFIRGLVARGPEESARGAMALGQNIAERKRA